ncbi:MAG: hypothetical protein KAR42_07245 [candidate division Zixibacteria bacterium]|nr:hypothetical protein [candidate division Zixibacteria bacterium]
MRKQFTIIFLALITVALFLAGCSDRTSDNPTRSIYDQRGLVFSPWAPHFESILISTSDDESGSKGVAVYTPSDFDPMGSGVPYPTLYLLTPFRSDELFYFKRGLAEVADRLIQEGKIVPMNIVSFDGQSVLGASFYTNSLGQGNFFTALYKDTTIIEVNWEGVFINIQGNSLISIIDGRFSTLTDPANRAICGIGVGGYGAIRGALETNLFGAVSAVNAPLDFDGDGIGGFRAVLNNLMLSNNWPVDTSKGDELTSLMVSAASAFSPHITALNTLIDTFYTDPNDSTKIILLNYHGSYYENDAFGIRTFKYVASDSLSDDLSTFLPLHLSHMPFDSTGAWRSNIWDLWMDNNIENLWNADQFGHASNFNSIPKLLISSTEAKFDYDEQMTSFEQFLSSNSITYTHQTFEGTDDLSGTASHYMYDLFEDLLIFHSNNFNVPD